MEIKNAIKERRSIRRFKDKKISKETIKEIIDVATYAPSWKNTQITRYIFVEDKEKISKIANDCVLGFTYNTKTMMNGAALILITAVKGRSGFERDGTPSTSKGDRWEYFDAGIATQTFCLAAQDKGLGTVILGVFDEDKVAEVVDIPEGQELMAIISIGYPDEEPTAPRRKTSDELLTFI